MYKFIFHPSVAHEIENSIFWYETKTTKIAKNFKNELKKSFHYLKRNPFLFQKIYKDCRAYSIQNFPYRIFYSIENNTIYIYSFFHSSRNPKIWQDRLLS